VLSTETPWEERVEVRTVSRRGAAMAHFLSRALWAPKMGRREGEMGRMNGWEVGRQKRRLREGKGGIGRGWRGKADKCANKVSM
jgi:hypothetical protein